MTYRDGTTSRWLAPAAGVGLGAVLVLSTIQLVVRNVQHCLYAVTVFEVIGPALARLPTVRPQVEWDSVPKLAEIAKGAAQYGLPVL